MRIITTLSFGILLLSVNAQTMTPEMLLQLGKLSTNGITKDGKSIVYSVRKYNVAEDKASTKKYIMPVSGGNPVEITNTEAILVNDRISSDGKYSISSNEVKVKNIYGKDVYPELKNSDVMIYDNLNYRHWDTWEDGSFGHVFLNTLKDKKIIDSI
ncbi:MAG: S9 family peptidase, partial [Bacteroidetes bacterium]|nr:S9 family peptidase [Bacteroidota bacterium]